MSKQTFRANEWLAPVFSQASGPGSRNSYPSEKRQQCSSNIGFSPEKFLVHGWTGDSLGTKSGLKIKSYSETLWKYALSLFDTFEDTNQTLKNSIYSEFLDFARSKKLKDHNFSSYIDFWPHLFSDASPFSKEIQEFKKIYCYRAVIIYLYRIQFITTLSKVTSTPLKERNYLNLSAYISKMFPSGSSKELICESLQSNRYSWFRPSSSYKDIIIKLSKEFEDLNTVEFLKIFSHIEEINVLPKFSHSLSHKHFGDFLNQLVNKVPKWLNPGNATPSLVNTKFTGNFLASLTNSFWLGQNKTDDTKNIISPDFIGESFNEGTFLKLCQEIQFLNNLLNHARAHNLRPVEFLSKTMKQKYALTSDDLFGQMKLFDPALIKGDLLYHRIFLNLVNFPKKNPHHHLVNQINAQSKSLKNDGFLFVFSNQNLFVPSQGERVSTLLQDFKMEAYFNFENLKGKGEIASYLYVLSKRKHSDKEKSQSKESCLFFRWSGNLNSFYNFSEFTGEMDKFIDNCRPFSRSIYHKELNGELSFEFHHDAILDGKLLHSSSQDTSKITHPSFFKKLTKFCTPLENCFLIESLNPQNKTEKSGKDYTLELLGYKIKYEEKYPFILIADNSDPNKIDLEIIPSSSYKAKVEKYGLACFQYFGLIPKKLDLNINVFREYFLTNIGQQIIQLSLDGPTKLKAKLQTLLVPKFFIPENSNNFKLKENFNFLKSKPSELLNFHPDFLVNNFNLFEDSINKKLDKTPLEFLDIIIQFKLTLELCLKNNNFNNSQLGYNNPIIREKLAKLPLKAIFNNNDNVHIETITNKKEHIHLPLTHTQIKQEGEDWYLEMSSDGIDILRLYSDPVLLHFTSYLLNSVSDIPISKILTSLAVPLIEDLKNVLDNFNDVEKSMIHLLKKSTLLISKIITQQITSFTLPS